MTNQKLDQILNEALYEKSLLDLISKTMDQIFKEDPKYIIFSYEVFHKIEKTTKTFEGNYKYVFFKHFKNTIKNIGFTYKLETHNKSPSIKEIKETLSKAGGGEIKHPFIKIVYPYKKGEEIFLFSHIENYRSFISETQKKLKFIKILRDFQEGNDSTVKDEEQNSSLKAENLFKKEFFHHGFTFSFIKDKSDSTKRSFQNSDFSYKDITGKALFDENEKEITKKLDFLVEKDGIIYCCEVKNSLTDGSTSLDEIKEKLYITKNLKDHFSKPCFFVYIVRHPCPFDAKQIIDEKGFIITFSYLIMSLKLKIALEMDKNPPIKNPLLKHLKLHDQIDLKSGLFDNFLVYHEKNIQV